MSENTDSKLGGQFIQLGEAKLRYFETGEGETVIFIHGIGQAMYTFRRNVLVLAEYCHVITVDLPGHGLSDSIDWDYTVEDFTQILIDFMDAMAIKKATLVGVGTGAMICLNIALKIPDSINRLILVSPGGITRHFPLIIRNLRFPLISDLTFTFFNNRMIKNTLASAYFDPDFLDRKTLRHYEKVFANREQLDAAITAFVAFKDADIIERLPDLNVPAYLFYGENDEWHPLKDVETLEELLPEEITNTIPECGHFPHEEKADEFNKKLIEILSK